jgi:5-methylcytosine-specific restriction enzyme subunit McrC
MASIIPIQNIYYLLVYAWDQLAEGALVDVTGIDSTELVDLYAAVLLNGLRHLLRRGLDRNYLPVESEIAGIRGRVQMGVTARRMLPQHGRTYCEYDELSVDTLPNRILLTTMRRLIKAPTLDTSLRDQLRQLDRSLGDISEIRLTKQAFRTVQLHGNNRFYKFLLSLCELILDSSISTEEYGRYTFRDFIRDPDRMAILFERFVFNFYRRECPDADVKREQVSWAARSADDPDLSFLPKMNTDISIRRPDKTLVIDTKFYQDTFQRYKEAEKVYSSNLYQMFSYLKNIEARGGQDADAEGILLYPVTAKRIRLRYEISGHSIRICTIDLAQHWKSIRQELLELVE